MATPMDVRTCLGRQRIEGEEEEEEEPDSMINGNPIGCSNLPNKAENRGRRRRRRRARQHDKWQPHWMYKTCLIRQRIEGEEEEEEEPDSMINGNPIGCTNLPRKAENQGRRRRRRRRRQHDKWQSHWMYEPA